MLSKPKKFMEALATYKQARRLDPDDPQYSNRKDEALSQLQYAADDVIAYGEELQRNSPTFSSEN